MIRDHPYSNSLLNAVYCENRNCADLEEVNFFKKGISRNLQRSTVRIMYLETQRMPRNLIFCAHAKIAKYNFNYYRHW